MMVEKKLHKATVMIKHGACLSLAVFCISLGINKLLPVECGEISMMLWNISSNDVYPDFPNLLHFLPLNHRWVFLHLLLLGKTSFYNLHEEKNQR